MMNPLRDPPRTRKSRASSREFPHGHRATSSSAARVAPRLRHKAPRKHLTFARAALQTLPQASDLMFGCSAFGLLKHLQELLQRYISPTQTPDLGSAAVQLTGQVVV